MIDIISSSIISFKICAVLSRVIPGSIMSCGGCLLPSLSFFGVRWLSGVFGV